MNNYVKDEAECFTNFYDLHRLIEMLTLLILLKAFMNRVYIIYLLIWIYCSALLNKRFKNIILFSKCHVLLIKILYIADFGSKFIESLIISLCQRQVTEWGNLYH